MAPPSEFPATWAVAEAQAVQEPGDGVGERPRRVGGAAAGNGGEAPNPGRSGAITSRRAARRSRTGSKRLPLASGSVHEHQRIAGARAVVGELASATHS